MWIFTFGVGQELGKYYQPVQANDYMQARKKMIEKHGLKWAFQYSLEEFERYREKYFNNLRPLAAL